MTLVEGAKAEAGKSGWVGVGLRMGRLVVVGVRLGLVGVVSERGLASGPTCGLWF